MARILIACLSAVLVLVGCAAPAPTALPPALFLDDAFAPPAAPVSASDALAMSPAMRAFLEQAQLGARPRATGRGLVDTLLASGVLKLDYDAQFTRTAAEAFEARSGNCLSLVLLTAALARELGLQVSYQLIATEGLWTREGGLLMHVAHVNIAIANERASPMARDSHETWVTIDFVPGAASIRAPSWRLDEKRILAMYLNNRAAEQLSVGRVDEAYWHARAAVQTDAGYVDGLNTLAVVYLRHGQVAQAERVLRQVLVREPLHAHALDNLASVLERQGRAAEALAVRAELRRVQAIPPFHDYDQGLLAMAAGDYERARVLFERESRRPGLQFHELHLNLARVYWQLRDLERVREQLELAHETSTTRAQQALYKAKLDQLRGTALH